MAALQVELVAADRAVWSGAADMVSARSIEGELGILPGHTPTLLVLDESSPKLLRATAFPPNDAAPGREERLWDCSKLPSLSLGCCS